MIWPFAFARYLLQTFYRDVKLWTGDMANANKLRRRRMVPLVLCALIAIVSVRFSLLGLYLIREGNLHHYWDLTYRSFALAFQIHDGYFYMAASPSFVWHRYSRDYILQKWSDCLEPNCRCSGTQH